MTKFRLGEDINGPVYTCGTPILLQRGIDYICESQSLAAYAALVDGNLRAEPITVARRISDKPSGILILRAGGAGDILFLTPVLAEVRRRFPGAYVAVAASPRYHWVLRGNPNVDQLFDMPIPLGDISRFDWVIDLEGVVERAVDQHVIDIFSDRTGVVLPSKLTVYLPEFSRESFEGQLPRRKKRIALQLTASTPVRTWPHILALGNLLRADGWEVALFSEPGQIKFHAPMLDMINISEQGWTWARSMDFLQTCDVAVGPDSSLIHFAGALNIPAIGIYGSFDARYRTAYQPSIQILQASIGCEYAPCFHHGRRLMKFPTVGPCNASGLCNSVASITPDIVIDKLRDMGL